MKIWHLKAFLAAILILCLAPFPDAYYLIVRSAATFGFAVLAFQAYVSKTPKVVLYLFLSFIFQPFYNVNFDEVFWLIIDSLVALWLIYDIYQKKSKSEKK
jgi:hypothetical protein